MELSAGFMPLVDLRFTEASRLKTQEAHSIIVLLAKTQSCQISPCIKQTQVSALSSIACNMKQNFQESNSIGQILILADLDEPRR